MIPLYILKPLEEIARAVALAVGAYVAVAVQQGTVQPTKASLLALLLGALPVAYAAARGALNRTALTPPQPAAIQGFTLGTAPHVVLTGGTAGTSGPSTAPPPSTASGT